MFVAAELAAIGAAHRLQFRSFIMEAPRITAEMKCEDLVGLLATERITAQMPAVTLEKLTMEMAPIKLEPVVVDEPAPPPPAYARGGTALPDEAPFPRFAVIAISAALTVLTAIGLAMTF